MKKKILGISLLAGLLVGGLFTGVIANKENVAGAKATSENENITLYLDSGGSSLWGVNDSVFYVMYSTGQLMPEYTSSLTLVTGNIYKTEIPKSTEAYMYLSYPSGTTDPKKVGFSHISNPYSDFDYNCLNIVSLIDKNCGYRSNYTEESFPVYLNAPKDNNICAYMLDDQCENRVLGGWPGKKITSIGKQLNGYSYNSNALYKVNIPGYTKYDKLVFSSSSTDNLFMTNDLHIVPGSLYDTSDTQDAKGSIAGGEATALAFKIVDSYGEISDTKTGLPVVSICGMSSNDAKSILDTYYNLSSDVKAVFDKFIYTEVTSNPSASTDYTMAQIIATVKSRVVGGYSIPSKIKMFGIETERDSMTYLVAIITLLVPALICAFLISKKHKKNLNK